MRPLLPQAKFCVARLTKSLIVCGGASLFCFLLVILGAVFYFEYLPELRVSGVSGLFDELRSNAATGDSVLVDFLRQCPVAVYFGVFGAGGIFGVAHYLFVRFRPIRGLGSHSKS